MNFPNFLQLLLFFFKISPCVQQELYLWLQCNYTRGVQTKWEEEKVRESGILGWARQEGRNIGMWQREASKPLEFNRFSTGSPVCKDWAQELSLLGYPSPSTHPSLLQKVPREDSISFLHYKEICVNSWLLQHFHYNGPCFESHLDSQNLGFAQISLCY